MKISRLEAVLLLITALALVFMAAYYLGSRSGLPVTVTAARDAEVSESVPVRESAAVLVDINTATAEELEALPGIGETRAAAIVEYREANGPFRRIEDLTQVAGIGEGILEQIGDEITVTAKEQGNG